MKDPARSQCTVGRRCGVFFPRFGRREFLFCAPHTLASDGHVSGSETGMRRRAGVAGRVAFALFGDGAAGKGSVGSGCLKLFVGWRKGPIWRSQCSLSRGLQPSPGGCAISNRRVTRYWASSPSLLDSVARIPATCARRRGQRFPAAAHTTSQSIPKYACTRMLRKAMICGQGT